MFESYLFNDTKTKQEIVDGCIFLIDKPLHWTSFDVVNKIKYALRKATKVGHGGTLDPLATGLLIVCTGKCTKMVTQFQNDDKMYLGKMVIGATRPSYDKETEINQHFDTNVITTDMLLENVKKFQGEIQQMPPVHSAVKVGGKPVYLKARKNIEVILQPRIVTIKSFELSDLDTFPEISFKVACTKGTYIRSLINDFGKELNNGAYLSQLDRWQSGGFDKKNALQLDTVLGKINELV